MTELVPTKEANSYIMPCLHGTCFIFYYISFKDLQTKDLGSLDSWPDPDLGSRCTAVSARTGIILCWHACRILILFLVILQRFIEEGI